MHNGRSSRRSTSWPPRRQRRRSPDARYSRGRLRRQHDDDPHSARHQSAGAGRRALRAGEPGRDGREGARIWGCGYTSRRICPCPARPRRAMSARTTSPCSWPKNPISQEEIVLVVDVGTNAEDSAGQPRAACLAPPAPPARPSRGADQLRDARRAGGNRAGADRSGDMGLALSRHRRGALVRRLADRPRRDGRIPAAPSGGRHLRFGHHRGRGRDCS